MPRRQRLCERRGSGIRPGAGRGNWQPIGSRGAGSEANVWCSCPQQGRARRKTREFCERPAGWAAERATSHSEGAAMATRTWAPDRAAYKLQSHGESSTGRQAGTQKSDSVGSSTSMPGTLSSSPVTAHMAACTDYARVCCNTAGFANVFAVTPAASVCWYIQVICYSRCRFKPI